MYINNKRVEVGTNVQLSTWNTFDANVYRGTVTGILQASLAKMVSDIIAYHTIMAGISGEIASLLTAWKDETYLIITDAQGVSTAIGVSWINTTTTNENRQFKVMEATSDVTLMVTGVPNGGVDLLEYIRAAGYTVNIVTTTPSGT